MNQPAPSAEPSGRPPGQASATSATPSGKLAESASLPHAQAASTEVASSNATPAEGANTAPAKVASQAKAAPTNRKPGRRVPTKATPANLRPPTNRRTPGQRPSAEQILTRVARCNLAVVATGALIAAGALAAASRPNSAAGVLAGAALVLATFALDLVFVRHERFDGPVRVVGFLAKLVVLALGAWGATRLESIDRAAIAWTVFAGLVASLAIASWIILRTEGPDFDMHERTDRGQENAAGN